MEALELVVALACAVIFLIAILVSGYFGCAAYCAELKRNQQQGGAKRRTARVEPASLTADEVSVEQAANLSPSFVFSPPEQVVQEELPPVEIRYTPDIPDLDPDTRPPGKHPPDLDPDTRLPGKHPPGSASSGNVPSKSNPLYDAQPPPNQSYDAPPASSNRAPTYEYSPYTEPPFEPAPPYRATPPVASTAPSPSNNTEVAKQPVAQQPLERQDRQPPYNPAFRGDVQHVPEQYQQWNPERGMTFSIPRSSPK